MFSSYNVDETIIVSKVFTSIGRTAKSFVRKQKWVFFLNTLCFTATMHLILYLFVKRHMQYIKLVMVKLEK